MAPSVDPTKKILIDTADGPERICIYTSETKGVTDWASDSPALYLEASVNGASVQLGPFHMSAIRKKFEQLTQAQEKEKQYIAALEKATKALENYDAAMKALMP